MNWNPTENCFFYHLSFILHGSLCALLLRYLFLVLLCPPLSPTSSFSLCLRVAAIPHRSSRCATANSHLPKRSCRVQVDGNVVSGNQIQVLREKAKQTHRERVKRQERGTYVAFFHHLVWCFLDKERKGDSFMVDMVFLVCFYCGLFAEKNLFFVLPYYQRVSFDFVVMLSIKK
jgi:hypothetical protein